LYWYGYGVPQNWPKAAMWYRKAANQGYAPAQSALASMFLEGEGVPQDNVRGYMWTSLAIAHTAPRLLQFRAESLERIGARMTIGQRRQAECMVQEWYAFREKRRHRRVVEWPHWMRLGERDDGERSRTR
jgi:hypothetical protein